VFIADATIVSFIVEVLGKINIFVFCEANVFVDKFIIDDFTSLFRNKLVDSSFKIFEVKIHQNNVLMY